MVRLPMGNGTVVPPEGTLLCSVNLSGHTLGSEDFLSFLLQELDQNGIAPEMLCFEITETAAISDITRASRFIEVLRKKGCHIALDDFGSGLSSFTYLKHFP